MPYPRESRYGPDRPLSPNPYPRNGSRSPYLSLVADPPTTLSSRNLSLSRYSQPPHSTPLVDPQAQRHASDSQRPFTFLSKQSPHSDSSPSASEPASHDPPAFLGQRSWTGSALPAPLVLTQEVILNLLNLGSDHRTSVSSAHTRSSSTSAFCSRLSRYSGDAEDEDAYSSFSHTTTVFDTDPDAYQDSPVAHSPGADGLDDSASVPGHIHGLDQPERMKSTTLPPGGDVANMHSFSPFIHPSAVNLSTSTDTVRSATITNADRPSTLIALNSPHSPLPHDVVSKSGSEQRGNFGLIHGNRLMTADDADVVELDFAETGVLSDANTFMNMIQEKERTRSAPAASASGNSSLQLNHIQLRTPESGATPIDRPVNSPPRMRINTEKPALLVIPMHQWRQSQAPSPNIPRLSVLKWCQARPREWQARTDGSLSSDKVSSLIAVLSSRQFTLPRTRTPPLRHRKE
jgi:hypothetical protein